MLLENTFAFDSDDYIDPSTIEKAYNTAQKNNSDMVLFGHYDVDVQGKNRPERIYLQQTKKAMWALRFKGAFT